MCLRESGRGREGEGEGERVYVCSVMRIPSAMFCLPFSLRWKCVLNCV